jgi:putative membrane protein
MSSRNNHGYVFVLGLAIMFILIGIAAVIAAVTKSSLQFPNYFGWIGGIMGLFIGLFFLVMFIWFISSIFRFARHYSGYRYWNWWDHDDAREILRERYAKGEITKEQFDQMMDDLERRGR